jgi:hypothetical protein
MTWLTLYKYHVDVITEFGADVRPKSFSLYRLGTDMFTSQCESQGLDLMRFVVAQV